MNSEGPHHDDTGRFYLNHEGEKLYITEEEDHHITLLVFHLAEPSIYPEPVGPEFESPGMVRLKTLWNRHYSMPENYEIYLGRGDLLAARLQRSKPARDEAIIAARLSSSEPVSVKNAVLLEMAKRISSGSERTLPFPDEVAEKYGVSKESATARISDLKNGNDPNPFNLENENRTRVIRNSILVLSQVKEACIKFGIDQQVIEFLTECIRNAERKYSEIMT